MRTIDGIRARRGHSEQRVRAKNISKTKAASVVLKHARRARCGQPVVTQSDAVDKSPTTEAAPLRQMAGAAPPEQHNWRIAQLYARNEFDECLAVVEKALTASNNLNEYPLYVKAS